MRKQHPPEYTARGTALGLFIAFTPTVGMQMPMVYFVWLLSKYLWPAKNFSLVVALAWTWVTNALTIAPIYYVFLVTGRIMLGRWDRLSGFTTFQDKITTGLTLDAGPLETVYLYMEKLFELFGLPMWVGSIPWALLVGWLGYRWSLRLVIRIRTSRESRKSARIKPSSET